MTDLHPITPPAELIDQLANISPWKESIVEAYRAGADAELDACCEWLLDHGYDLCSPKMRKDRRPKPPSLAKEALDTLKTKKLLCFDYPEGYDIIRRALERLQELEKGDD